MLYDDKTASQTFELYGPKNYSTAEIAELVDREIFKRRRHINVPKSILKPAAGLLNRLLWWDIMSADEVEREFHDQVIDETAKTFKDLGIEPTDISQWTYHYLVRVPTHLASFLVCFCCALMTDPHTARLSQLNTLRPAARDGEGDAGGEEVSPRARRPVKWSGGWTDGASGGGCRTGHCRVYIPV